MPVGWIMLGLRPGTHDMEEIPTSRTRRGTYCRGSSDSVPATGSSPSTKALSFPHSPTLAVGWADQLLLRASNGLPRILSYHQALGVEARAIPTAAVERAPSSSNCFFTPTHVPAR